MNSFSLTLKEYCPEHRPLLSIIRTSHFCGFIYQEESSLLSSGVQSFDWGLITQIYKRGFLKQWEKLSAKQAGFRSQQALVIYCCNVSLLKHSGLGQFTIIAHSGAGGPQLLVLTHVFVLQSSVISSGICRKLQICCGLSMKLIHRRENGAGWAGSLAPTADRKPGDGLSVHIIPSP